MQQQALCRSVFMHSVSKLAGNYTSGIQSVARIKLPAGGQAEHQQQPSQNFLRRQVGSRCFTLDGPGIAFRDEGTRLAGNYLRRGARQGTAWQCGGTTARGRARQGTAAQWDGNSCGSGSRRSARSAARNCCRQRASQAPLLGRPITSAPELSVAGNRCVESGSATGTNAHYTFRKLHREYKSSL